MTPRAARRNHARATYERNVVFRSTLTGDFFFAPKVRVLTETTRKVVGRKYNITTMLQPYLLKKYRRPDDHA